MWRSIDCTINCNSQPSLVADFELVSPFSPMVADNDPRCGILYVQSWIQRVISSCLDFGLASNYYLSFILARNLG